MNSRENMYLMMLVAWISLGVLGRLGTAQTSQKTPTVASDRMWLHRLAAEARARHQDRVTLSPPQSPRIRVSGLAEALNVYSVVEVEVLAHEMKVWDGRFYTWYKTHLVQVLSPNRSSVARPIPPALTALPDGLVPTMLLPAADSDVLLFVGGGSLQVDGVEIRTADQDYIKLRSLERYILFGIFSPDHKILTIPLLTEGVYEISSGFMKPLAAGDGFVARELTATPVASFRRYVHDTGQ